MNSSIRNGGKKIGCPQLGVFTCPNGDSNDSSVEACKHPKEEHMNLQWSLRLQIPPGQKFGSTNLLTPNS